MYSAIRGAHVEFLRIKLMLTDCTPRRAESRGSKLFGAVVLGLALEDVLREGVDRGPEYLLPLPDRKVAAAAAHLSLSWRCIEDKQTTEFLDSMAIVALVSRTCL